MFQQTAFSLLFQPNYFWLITTHTVLINWLHYDQPAIQGHCACISLGLISKKIDVCMHVYELFEYMYSIYNSVITMQPLTKFVTVISFLLKLRKICSYLVTYVYYFYWFTINQK